MTGNEGMDLSDRLRGIRFDGNGSHSGKRQTAYEFRKGFKADTGGVLFWHRRSSKVEDVEMVSVAVKDPDGQVLIASLERRPRQAIHATVRDLDVKMDNSGRFAEFNPFDAKKWATIKISRELSEDWLRSSMGYDNLWLRLKNVRT